MTINTHKDFGTRECPSCATEVPANNNRCPICGYDFPHLRVNRRLRVWGAIIMLALLILLIAGALL